MAYFAFSTVEYDVADELPGLLEGKRVRSQAEFLGLALALDVPVVGKSINTRLLEQPDARGAGASFSVSGFQRGLSVTPGKDLVNDVSDDWFDGLPSSDTSRVNLVYVV